MLLFLLVLGERANGHMAYGAHKHENILNTLAKCLFHHYSILLPIFKSQP